MGTCWQCDSWSVTRWPQSQEGDWARPHLCKLARHGPWLVRKRFIEGHVWRRRSKPGCRIVGSVTVVWLTTEADDQFSFHCVIVSTDAISDHIGRRDASRGGGCSKTSAYTGQFGWVSIIWSILSVAALRRIEEVQHCWALTAMRAAWVAGSLKSGALNYEVGRRWDLLKLDLAHTG